MNRAVLNNSGVILASALWVIIILSLLAISVGRNSGIDASLMNYALGRMKSYYAASAGIAYALNLIRQDTTDEQTNQFDSLYQCGLKLENDKSIGDVMGGIAVGEDESFDIKYSDTGYNSVVKEALWGFQDEERKINLNAMTASNNELLAGLIVELGFSQDDADIIAASVVDWRDDDNNVTSPPKGAEAEYYGQAMTSSYLCKNRPFDHVQELLLIKGMRSDIFEKLKDYVTVYPKEPLRLAINFNTAPVKVIKVFVEYAVHTNASLDSADTDSLVEKVIRFRNGPDGKSMTADDQILLLSGNIGRAFNFTIPEEHLYLSVIQAYHVPVSKYFRVNAIGLDRRSSVTSRIGAVIDREKKTIIAWYRD